MAEQQKNTLQKIILAKPRGFCAGVDRAVRAVEECLRVFGAPVYVKHEIVHNKTVVAELATQGAVTIEDIREVPDGAVVVFSAHGSPPEHYRVAREKRCTMIDATCPFVTKVHLEMHRFLKAGYQVVYIGHKGHIEGVGVCREAAEYSVEIPVIENVHNIDVLTFERDAKLAYLTQTTLSVEETKVLIEALQKKYPNIVAPPSQDICCSTTNRQQAVQALARQCGVVLVVGSKNSSNSNRLAEVARQTGAQAYLIDGANEVLPEWLEGVVRVGVTAGASAPEHLVQELLLVLSQSGAIIEELELVREDLHFAEPVELTKAKKERRME
ncbi:MAG: 4-hydroxy-3-methylbut-2-enyl diphosphate reductase [Candidatus Moraniibacteriota bacterium]